MVSRTTFELRSPPCCTHASFVWNHSRYNICWFQLDHRMAMCLISGLFFSAFRCTTCFCTWNLLVAIRVCSGWSAPNGNFRASLVLWYRQKGSFGVGGCSGRVHWTISWAADCTMNDEMAEIAVQVNQPPFFVSFQSLKVFKRHEVTKSSYFEVGYHVGI